MNYHSAFFIYYSKIYFKCVFWLVHPFSLRFIAYGLLDKQNLLDSDSADSALAVHKPFCLDHLKN